MEISGISGELVMDKHQLIQALNTIWVGLHGYREDSIPEGIEESWDEQWGEICTAMAHIHEALDIKHEEVD